MSDSQLPSDQFVGFLTESQDSLRAYVLACLGNYSDASDVLQKTNVVLLRKSRDFLQLKDFQAWAIRVAKFEVLAHVRDRNRERLAFYPELIEVMTEEVKVHAGVLEARQLALRKCLARLPVDKQQLIRMRYAEDLSVSQVAADMGRSLGSVKAMLRRLRSLLHECVEKQLSELNRSAT